MKAVYPIVLTPAERGYVVFVPDLNINTEGDTIPDAIAMGGYPIDVHSPDGAAMKHRFLRPGSWYSIPYRCLTTEEIQNLVVAGRCISATHEACAAIRVTPIVMAAAQAAGTAAAQSAALDQPANALDTDTLRATLKADGMFLEPYVPEQTQE